MGAACWWGGVMGIPATMNDLEMLDEKVVQEPGWWIDFCAQVTDGEKWWEGANKLYVKPAVFMAWINVDEKRKKDFLLALECRELLSKEKAKHRLAGFVDATVREADVNPTHVLSAIEKTLGKDRDGSGGGGVTVIVQRGGTEPPRVSCSGDGKTLTIGDI